MLKKIKFGKKYKKVMIIKKAEEPELKPDFVAKIHRREKQDPVEYKL